MIYYQDDYKAVAHIEIMKGLGIGSIRISKDLTDEESKIASGMFKEGQRQVIEIGDLRIWMWGSLEYIGPPERHPELKYQTK